MIKAIAFDLLGVLLKVNHEILNDRQLDMARTFGVIPGDDDFVNHFSNKFQLSSEAVEKEIIQLISLLYAVREPDLFDHLPDLQFAVASNHLSFISNWIRSLPIGSYFDIYFTSGDRGLAKPSPAYYYALAHELLEPPVNILLVDDTPANCEGAASIGMKTALYTPDLKLSEVVLAQL